MKNDSFLDIYLNCDPEFLEEAQYVFATLFEILGIPFQLYQSAPPTNSKLQKIIINYVQGINDRNFPNTFVINIAASDHDKFLQLKEPEVRFINGVETSERIGYLYSKKFKSLKKILFLDSTTGEPLITCSEDQVNCSVDLISSAFHLLTLQNEECIKKRDSLGRFQRNFSKKSNEIYDCPIVDLYCKLLFDFLKRASNRLSIPIVQKEFWPHDHKFALCLTHDIDRFNTWTLRKVLRTLKFIFKEGYFYKINIFLQKFLQLLLSVSHPANWRGNFETILDEEKKFDFHSSFYFVAQKRYKLDPTYRLNSKRLAKIFKYLVDEGREIGLHGSIRSADNGHFLKMEKKRLEEILNQEVYGCRQHFLRFVYPDTFENIEQTSLKYDSTLGFGDAIGYRAGISFPYRPYNRRLNRPFNFYEIPLIVMDTSLTKDENFTLLDESNHGELFSQIEGCLKSADAYNGCLTLLWHNSDFDPVDATGYTRLYRDILKWVQKKQGWGCSAHELWDWWNNRTSYDLSCNLSQQDVLEISAKRLKSKSIFLKIYFPIQYRDCLIDCINCDVNWRKEGSILKLNVENIRGDSIGLKIHSRL